MEFVDVLPPDGRRSGSQQPEIDMAVLRANVGRWAEVGRYPKAKRDAAGSRGRYFVRRNEGTEYVTRLVGDEVIVFVRAVSA